MDFETALREVGDFGTQQKLQVGVLSCLQLCLAAQLIGLVFLGAPPSFHCKDQPANHHDPCSLEPSCKEYQFGSEFTSIVSEWDLVCEKSTAVSSLQSYFMFGVLLGNFIFGGLCDSLGRRRTYMFCIVSIATVSSMSCFIQSYYIFAVSRFLDGFLTGGVIISSYVLAIETIGAGYRMFVGTFFSFIFAVGIMLFSLEAYLVSHWRSLILLTSLPFYLLTVVYCIMPESPRWLYSQGRLSEAEDALYVIAQRNGRKVQVTLKEMPKQGQTFNAGYVDFFKTPVFRKQMLIQILTWFSCSFLYYGFTMSAGNLGSNLYFNVALSGLSEVPAYVLCILFVDRVGRKKCLCASLTVGGLACVGLLLNHINDQNDSSSSSLNTIFAMVGKMGVAAAFNIAYIYSNELLPTVLRNSGLGVCSMAARIGGILAPKAADLSFSTTYTLFGSAALLSGFLVLQLPESLGKPLPETIDDIENARSVPHIIDTEVAFEKAGDIEEKLSMLKNTEEVEL